jgi:hypothetical protein
MKPKAFFVVSQWNNDVSWVDEYTDDYLIYDKSNTLSPRERVFKISNIGYNIHDIFHFIVNNYNDLPDVIAFLEGNPFDHCNVQKFNSLIYNEKFTPIESYEHLIENNSHKKGEDGGYMEPNNSWYINAHNKTHNIKCKYPSFDYFMNLIFKNYVRQEWLRFSPGGQYIVEKEKIIYYTLNFWKFLLSEITIFDSAIPTEGHVMERSLYYIFTNRFEQRRF